jgi:hypothetical protein
VTWGQAGGLVLALASAAALNWSYFVQHGAAAAMPALALRRPLRSLASLFGNRRWLMGFWTGIGGWILYVVALTLAPLSLVQACAAGGLAVLAALAGIRSRRERLAVATSIAGLGLLAISLTGNVTVSHHASLRDAAVWMLVSAAAAAVAAGPAADVFARGAGLGTAAGVLYAAGDVGTKAALTNGFHVSFVPALLVCHGLAFVALQLGFQRGGPLATAGVATLWTNALPILAGMIVFGEPLPGGARGVARVAAFVAVVVGAALLARSGEEEAPEASSRRGKGPRIVAGVGAAVILLVSAGTVRASSDPPLANFATAESWEGYFHPFPDGSFAHASRTTLAAHDPSLLARRQAAAIRSHRVRFFLSTGGSHGSVKLRWTFHFAAELRALGITERLWAQPPRLG